MERALVALVLACCLPATATGPAVAGPTGAAAHSVGDVTHSADAAYFADAANSVDATHSADFTHPSVVAAYPNPVADEDVGEYVVLSVPSGVDPSGYALSDGETNVSLANVSAGATVAVANHPRAGNVTDRPVRVVPSLSLSNAGERLRIVRNGTTVHERRYRDAPEGEVARWNGSRIGWRPVGATDRPVVRGDDGTVEAFVLPDSPAVPVETLRGADRRILLGGYTLTSDRVADVLVRSARRNVTVRVLLEGGPVGGQTRRQARVLDRLVRAGVAVRMVGGPNARYDYHHAKYAVVDERAVVMTENWKPAGTGGNSSRGWGVVTRQSRVVESLATTFRADWEWRDARPWRTFRQGRQFERGESSAGGYPTNFDPERVHVDRTDVLVTPDNAQTSLVRTLDSADESVDVIQVTLGSWDSPLVSALRRAARRGVEVRVLLSSAWYAREDNREVVERFDEWATERDAPLTAKLADPRGRYGKIHAKGAVVDDERVVLGSLNWNEQAATSNREVILVFHGESVAGYYGRVFDADWGGGRRKIPLGVVGAVAGCLALVGLVARRLEFE